LDRARAVLTRAKADHERLQSVYAKDPGATSQAAIDRARQAQDSAAANITSLAASVDAAKDRLSYTYLKAPFDGNVVRIYVENFQDVTARQPVMRIVDDSRVEFVINIPESLISYVPDVTDVRVTFDPFPGREIPAAVKEIGTEASESTRTYPVTLIMDQPDGFKILPGMAGKATGTPPEGFRPTTAEIPVAAVFSRDGTQNSYVWVIDPDANTVHQREVQVGQLADHGVLIKAGLEPGEWIATAGVDYLFEGREVRLLKEGVGE
jgi:RND family efflux transporter MFP subunit